MIKAVYEVDPLKCPKCGGIMQIVSFIEEDDVIRKILKHCNLPAYRSTSAGRWKEPAPRPPPPKAVAPVADTEPYYDFTFIEPA